MTWKNITVQQFQDIYRLSLSTELDETAKVERVISAMYNLTEKQIGEMSLQEFNDKAKECAFILDKQAIPGKPVKTIRVGARVYKIEYNPAKLRHRQYVEIMHFGNKPVDNMHYIMASLVRPVKWGFARKNKAEQHADIATDMLSAPLCDVYHTAVFFWKLFTNSIASLKGCLEKELIAKKMPKELIQQIVNISLSNMAGFIPLTK